MVRLCCFVATVKMVILIVFQMKYLKLDLHIYLMHHATYNLQAKIYVTYGRWKTVSKNYFDKASEEHFLKSFSLLRKPKDFLKISIIYPLYTAIYLFKYRKSTQLHQEKSFCYRKRLVNLGCWFWRIAIIQLNDSWNSNICQWQLS